MTYLDSMVKAARADSEARQAALPIDQLKALTPPLRAGFVETLQRPGISLIAEYKRWSPSAGHIHDRSIVDTLVAYEAGGASAASVLTDAEHFHGSLQDLRDASAATALPLLRKDFIVSEYQVVEASRFGASAILLIVAALSPNELVALLDCAAGMGLDVVTEVHDETELSVALSAKAQIVGVNNRNLHDLTVDLSTSERLSALMPKGLVRVAESGIKTAADVRRIRDCGFDAVLVGESLLRTGDPAAECRNLLAQ